MPCFTAGCDYVSATFLAYAWKTGMPLRTLLSVGQHIWDDMQQHGGTTAPPFYARGPDFFPLGARGFCQALLTSERLPKGLATEDMQRMPPALERVAACSGLPEQALLQRLAGTLAPFIHPNPAAYGIVYMRLPRRGRKNPGPPVVITEKAGCSCAFVLEWSLGRCDMPKHLCRVQPISN